MNQAKPGGGLPKLEQLSLKYILVPLGKRVFSWDSALNMFNSEVKRIEQMVKEIEEEKWQERIMIDRVFGIEDHSRDYSINMVIEHLNIVGYGIMGVIHTLSKEERVEKEIKIENVKPQGSVEDELNRFLAFSRVYNSFIEKLPKRKSNMTKLHPWFVELNNVDWSIFMAIHTFVHRRQIEAIIKGIKKQ
jgi:hypothetical protein